MNWAVRGAANPEAEVPTSAQIEGPAQADRVADFGEGIRFNARRETHRLWIAVSSNRAIVMVASNGGRPGDSMLEALEQRLGEITLPEQQQQARRLIEQLRGRFRIANAAADREIQAMTSGGQAPSPPRAAEIRIIAALRQLSAMLAELFVYLAARACRRAELECRALAGVRRRRRALG